MLSSQARVLEFHPPGSPWGECNDARNDTHHRRDYLPAGRLQRPFWGLRLRLGPLRDGYWRGGSWCSYACAAGGRNFNWARYFCLTTISRLVCSKTGFIITPFRGWIYVATD